MAFNIADKVFESLPDSVIITDGSQRIVRANAAAYALFGWPLGDLPGQKLDVLLPDGLRERHSAHVDRFLAGSLTALDMSSRGELVGRQFTGGEFPPPVPS